MLWYYINHAFNMIFCDVQFVQNLSLLNIFTYLTLSNVVSLIAFLMTFMCYYCVIIVLILKIIYKILESEPSCLTFGHMFINISLFILVSMGLMWDV